MENISNRDFDRLEELIRSKQIEELSTNEKQWVLELITPEEYSRMAELYKSISHSNVITKIEPQSATKAKLDKALAEKKQPTTVFKLKMPVYQSVAAALLFFFIGFGINHSRPLQTRIVHNTTQVIKYIERPAKYIEYVTVQPKNKKSNIELKRVASTPPAVETNKGNDIILPETNPEVFYQQEIAMNNIHRVQNERIGTTMGGDTVLQKMMVTVY